MSDFSWLSLPSLGSIVTSALLMAAVVGVWVWYQLRQDPEKGTIDVPDATACLRGKCGDAMKISLKFRDDRVVDAKYWTDGCGMSSACGAAAARLALNKTPEEVADIDYVAIEHEVGGLPEDHLHCATLAAGTLQEALKNYLTNSERKTA